MTNYLTSLIILAVFFHSCSPIKNTTNMGKQNKLFLTTLKSNDVGEISFYMNYVENQGRFEMFTERNTDIKLFGLLKAIGGRIFINTIKKGSLLSIRGIAKNDSLLGKLTSPLGTYDFSSEKKNNEISGSLSYKGKKIGEFQSIISKQKKKIRDYPKLINRAIEITESNIYNPKLLNTKEWRTFKKNITKKARKFDDDLELITYFFYKSRKLPFSHYTLLKKDFSSEKNQGEVYLKKISHQTALLEIENFNNNKELLKSTLIKIINHNYKNLVIDLRKNGGGNIESALTLSSYIIDKPLNGGYFVTQKWYNKNINNKAPDNFNTKHFHSFSKANYELLIQGIHRYEGLILEVKPNKKNYKGNIFILTDDSTASTCEPIVYGLKLNHKATIIGEKTAGAMLSAETFDLFDGFKLFLPTADYYTSDGKRLDRIGVEPDYKIESKNALDFVLNNLLSKNTH